MNKDHSIASEILVKRELENQGYVVKFNGKRGYPDLVVEKENNISYVEVKKLMPNLFTREQLSEFPKLNKPIKLALVLNNKIITIVDFKIEEFELNHNSINSLIKIYAKDKTYIKSKSDNLNNFLLSSISNNWIKEKMLDEKEGYSNVDYEFKKIKYPKIKVNTTISIKVFNELIKYRLGNWEDVSDIIFRTIDKAKAFNKKVKG